MLALKLDDYAVGRLSEFAEVHYPEKGIVDLAVLKDFYRDYIFTPEQVGAAIEKSFGAKYPSFQWENFCDHLVATSDQYFIVNKIDNQYIFHSGLNSPVLDMRWLSYYSQYRHETAIAA